MRAGGTGGRIGAGRLSARDRRAIRIGTLVLLPALLWVGVVRPYRSLWGETQDRLDAERALLARERALLEGAAALPDSVREAGRQIAAARDRLVDAPTLELAEAELTSVLERLAAASRVLLEEMRGIEPPRSADRLPDLEPIRLAVRGQSDLNGVTAFLRRIEESRWLFRVEELSIQPAPETPTPSPRAREPQVEAEPPAQGTLEFALIIEAYTAPASTGRASAREAGT
jgi:hypothetical protein